MQSRTVWLYALLSLLFVGCSSKEERALLQECAQKRHYYKQLLHTEKVQLYSDNETEILLTATYIFTSTAGREEEDLRDEHFIVGLYMEDDSVAQTLMNEDFTLTLNGESAKRVTVLQRSDRRLKQIPFVTAWGDYFEVVFPHTTETKFTLLFSSKAYGKKRLHFAKKAKYIFTKEAF